MPPRSATNASSAGAETLAPTPGAHMLEPRPWSQLIERVESHADPASRRVVPIVALVVVLCGLALVAFSTASKSPDWAALPGCMLLASIGLGAERLHYRQHRSTSGSIAFIPWTACVLYAPTLVGISSACASVVLVQLVARRSLLKAIFNVSQLTLALVCAGLVYLACRGSAFSTLARSPILDVARHGLPATLAAVSTYSLVNALTVSGVVAVAEQRSYRATLRANGVITAPFNILGGLITFYLCWLFVNLGAVGAAGLALPMVAVRQLYKTTMQLTNVTEELLDLMVAAIEARDPYTSGHSQRVSKASRIIARGLGLKDADVERVAVAALLHDVGKIDQAFAPILAKEGKLTADEWELMKRHPIRSAELVAHVSNLRDIVGALRHHHERWDGRGYPDGLAGAAIPLAARIITFADTLDAMTSDRPYRKALGPEEARAELIRCREKQFDPEICDKVVSDRIWPELYQLFKTEHAAAGPMRVSA